MTAGFCLRQTLLCCLRTETHTLTHTRTHARHARTHAHTHTHASCYRSKYALSDNFHVSVTVHAYVYIYVCIYLCSLIHIKPLMPHVKSNTQLWVKKGNFIHKVPDIKQLNNWWSRFHCAQFCALCTCLGGTTPTLLTTARMLSTCYLISMTCTSILQHRYSKLA